MQRQFVRSERAHFMCPNMHFGIRMALDTAYDPEKLQKTVQDLAAAHPFLRSVIAEDDAGALYYRVTAESQILVAVREDVFALWADWKSLSQEDWNVFENGLLKLFVYPQEAGMTVLFAAHHLLTDGRGLLDLAQEFANDYTKGIVPAYAEEVLIESIGDLPEKSALAGMSRWLVKRMNRLWKKEGRTVSYETYRRFAAEYGRTHPVEYESYTVGADQVAQMLQTSRENGFSVNDLLMAEMYLRSGAEKIIIAADIRDRFPKYQKGAMGNYSTAMGIVCKPKSANVTEVAKQVHALVQKHRGSNRSLMLVLACYFEMDPALLDAAAISALGGFGSKSAQFVGGGMFGFARPKSHSLTNLGRVENENIRTLQFIPPASPAAKFTLGVVTLNGTLYACSSKNTWAYKT